MGKIKTLLTVNVSQRIRSNVGRIIEKMAARTDAYQWVEPENLHVQVNFVGEVLDREAAEFCAAIKPHASQFSPFELSFCGVAAFPDADTPRTIYLAVNDGAQQLALMNRELTKAIQDWGFNKDKNAFVPHMTLGRLRRGARWDDAIAQSLHRLRNHDSGICTVDSIVINSCYSDPGGPTYTPMATIKLS